MTTKIVTCIYSKLHGTNFGGRCSRELHYKYSLLSLLKIQNAEFVLYTSPEEYEDLCSFFYKQNNINNMQIKIFNLYNTKYFDKIDKIKDKIDIKKSQRCHEVQYNKFYWIEDEIKNDNNKYENYYWLDAGLSHSGIIPEEHRVLTNNYDKYFNSTLFNNNFLDNLIKKTEDDIYIITKCNTGIHYWSKTAPNKYYNEYDSSLHVIGGIFGGKKNQMQNYISLFDEALLKLLTNEKTLFYEELIMTLLYYNNKNIFTADFFETWWHKESGFYKNNDTFYVKNKSFYKVLEELN
jgi:hypothetical protein